jgi:hypothetical protein
MMVRIIPPYKLMVQYRQESATMEIHTLSVIVDMLQRRIVFSALDDLTEQFRKFTTVSEVHLFVKRGFTKGVAS